MEHIGPARLRALLDAVLSVASDLDLSSVLDRIVRSAADLADANYAALGVLNESQTGLSDFLTVGIPSEEIAKIGNLPRGHGILGLLIVDPKPLRLPNLSEHPESYGFPPNHPPMSSFLGVPILLHNRVFGNLYLTDKRSAEEFSDIDEEVVTTLASAAGIAIENARLHAQVESLAVLEDRERIARDLHDTVIQRVFATGLSLQAAAQLAPGEVSTRINQAVDQLDTIVREVRSAIFELEEPSLPTSVNIAISSVTEEVGRMLGFPIQVDIDPDFRSVELSSDVRHSLISTLREALSNVARHAHATTVSVKIRVNAGSLILSVIDNGKGIPPDYQPKSSGGKGLGNAADRAQQLGGHLILKNRPEGGTILEWEVPQKVATN